MCCENATFEKRSFSGGQIIPRFARTQLTQRGILCTLVASPKEVPGVGNCAGVVGSFATASITKRVAGGTNAGF